MRGGWFTREPCSQLRGRSNLRPAFPGQHRGRLRAKPRCAAPGGALAGVMSKSHSSLLLLALAAAFVPALTAADMFVYFGTHRSGPGLGFSLAHFDTDTGVLTTPRFLLEAQEPAFFVIDRDGRHLYTCNSGDPGRISAYAIDPQTAQLTLLNQAPSGGGDPSYICLDRTGRFAARGQLRGRHHRRVCPHARRPHRRTDGVVPAHRPQRGSQAADPRLRPLDHRRSHEPVCPHRRPRPRPAVCLPFRRRHRRPHARTIRPTPRSNPAPDRGTSPSTRTAAGST